MLHLLLQAADPLFHLDDGPLYLKKLVVDAPMAGQVLVLGQIAQCFAFGKHGLPRIRLHLSDDDAQERGLAGAVDADDGGLLVVFYMK